MTPSSAFDNEALISLQGAAPSVLILDGSAGRSSEIQGTGSGSTMIGVTTRNRKGYVKFLARSFEFLNVYQRPHYDVWIFDDASEEYTIHDLRRWFPQATTIVRNSRASGSAAEASRRMYRRFAFRTNYDNLLVVDSDMLLHPDALSWLERALPASDGVVSVYRSRNHENFVRCTSNVSIPWCTTDRVGNAGVAMTREEVVPMLRADQGGDFDWGFVEHFRRNGVRILVPRNKSLAEHLGGFYGQSINVSNVRADRLHVLEGAAAAAVMDGQHSNADGRLFLVHGDGNDDDVFSILSPNLAVSFDLDIFPDDIRDAVRRFRDGAESPTDF